MRTYSLTKDFPKSEIFGITNQMRRCAVSVTSNIAEGFSRKTRKEKIQFYRIALGSINELQKQLLISRDIDYITKEEFQEIAENTVEVQKLILGLIKSAKDFKI